MGYVACPSVGLKPRVCAVDKRSIDVPPGRNTAPKVGLTRSRRVCGGAARATLASGGAGVRRARGSGLRVRSAARGCARARRSLSDSTAETGQWHWVDEGVVGVVRR